MGIGLRDAAKVALICMEDCGVCVKASEALRAALAEAEAPKAEPIDSEERTGALGALNALFHENGLPMSDRNGVLYDAIRAKLAEAPKAEPVDEEVIGECYGVWANNTREWWSGGAWLYPGDAVVVRRAVLAHGGKG